MQQKIVQLSTVHRAIDTRIFHKECRSLVEAGYAVTLIARADSDQCIQGVQVRAITAPSRTVWCA